MAALIIRRPGWQTRLNDAIEAAEARPFAWNGGTCAHFVADAVKAMCGTDPLRGYRGMFRTERAAWAALAARDGTLARACRRIFGASIHPSRARAGDVVLMRGGAAIGLAIGRGLVAFASETEGGIVRAPLALALRAYPIGWPDEAAG